MRNSYDVIEVDNYVILNTLQNFHFREYSFFVYQHAEHNIGKIFKNNIILITKYLNLDWNYFLTKMIDFKIWLSKLLLVSGGRFVLNLIPYCIILRYSAPLDN